MDNFISKMKTQVASSSVRGFAQPTCINHLGQSLEQVQTPCRLLKKKKSPYNRGRVMGIPLCML